MSFYITDHLLSYFLGGEANNGDTFEADTAVERKPTNGADYSEPCPPHRPASQPSSSNALGRLYQNQSGSSIQNLPIEEAAPAASSSGQLRVHFSDDSLAAYQARQNGQISGSSVHNHTAGSQGSLQKVPSTASTTGSSNSSLTNLAAALALGAPPNQVMIMQQQLQAREVSRATATSDSLTPITPLTMMSPRSHETMMLPPPPRFPVNGMMPTQNMSQQQLQLIQQQHLHMAPQLQQQQGQIPEPIIQPSWNQHLNGSGTTQQHMQFQQTLNQNHHKFPHTPHVSFPDPSSVTGSVLSQPQVQQIHIGLSGQTIPVTAVTGANGTVLYQIDPHVAPAANLRYFTKAINEVSKPVEQKEDPVILAEKRQRRLARNRESARQSRRRKKERLVNLGSKVNQLQRQLETEVRQKVQSMEAGLKGNQTLQVQRWIDGGLQNNDEFMEILERTGVNCPIRRAVVAHQYDFLRQSFFASHNQFSVWLMRQPHNYFTASNFLKPTPMPDKDPSKKSTAGTRANSKLVGEKLFEDEKDKNEGKGVICQADDEVRVWPLYCLEVGMTMEQEERIVTQAHRDFQDTPHLQDKLQQINTVRSATKQMQNIMLCLSQVSSQRNKVLLDTLTPAQTVAFLDWVTKNKVRAQVIMERHTRAEKEPTSLDNTLQKLEGVRLKMNPFTPSD
jgi:hypothetical protein